MAKKKLVITLSAIVIILAIAAYLVNFNSHSISKETHDWGAFSDYLNPFIGFCNLIIFVWFSLEIYKYNKNKDDQNESFQKAIEKPILILVSTTDSSRSSRETWNVYNIGKGAALNLKVGESHSRHEQWITPITKCYSLGSKDKLPLDWLVYANMICVTYEDVFGHEYVTLAADDQSYIRTVATFKEIAITDYVFTFQQLEAFRNLPRQRLHAARNIHSRTLTSTTETTRPPSSPI